MTDLPRAHLRAPWFRVALARARAAGRAVVDELLVPLAGISAAAAVVWSAVLVADHLPRKQAVATCVEATMPAPAVVEELVTEFAHQDPRFERTLSAVVEVYGAQNLECGLAKENAALP